MAFTFFFRDSHTLDQACNYLLKIRNQGNIFKIWDAGCAMGPEPYTFALILREKIGSQNFEKVTIHASDIDESGNFGSILTAGEYPEPDLIRMPPNIFNKYFKKLPSGKYAINEQIRSKVQYRWHDLLTLKPFDNNYDLIICKNVLLHFNPQQRIDVIKMFHNSLKPNGLLITEQTQPMPDELNNSFDKIATDACIFLKK